MPTGSASWSIASSPIAATSGLPPDCDMPDCASRPGQRRGRRLPGPTGLDRALFHKLTDGEWIDTHDNLILCGPTGVGKSWLACALGHKACRDNRSVLYQRVPKLFPELALARGDGRYARILRGLTGVQLLILDDWGLEPLDAGARRDLYEILEERYGRHSTILTSQIPVDKWHALIGDPTYADAILDRLVHNAHRIDLAGDSLRRRRSRSTAKD
jgi:DNA replication protein DnaC